MNVAVGGKIAVFGTSESSNLITLRLSTVDYSEVAQIANDSKDVFGELRELEEEDELYEEPGI